MDAVYDGGEGSSCHLPLSRILFVYTTTFKEDTPNQGGSCLSGTPLHSSPYRPYTLYSEWTCWKESKPSFTKTMMNHSWFFSHHQLLDSLLVPILTPSILLRFPLLSSPLIWARKAFRDTMNNVPHYTVTEIQNSMVNDVASLLVSPFEESDV